jgi:hypothetical protein
MIHSESDHIPLQVIYSDVLRSDGLLIMLGRLKYLLGVRANLDPKAAEIIQMDAAEIVNKEAASLQDGELKGKMWLNGKWSDVKIKFDGTFNKEMLL